MEWSAEIAAREMWTGLDLTESQGKIHLYFKRHLQAAYDAGFRMGHHDGYITGFRAATKVVKSLEEQ